MPTYVVTGASSGIGLELVTLLAARGDKVFATCRSKASSATKVDLLSNVTGDVTIIEGIDVATDECKEILAASALKGVKIDVVVHNAGGINGTRDIKGGAVMADQAFGAVSSERMLAAFNLNTLGPLRVQQALSEQMTSPGGKVAIISTGMASITDNGSGGIYAYRTAKAAVNMVAKSMSVDFKDRGIAVVAVAPGVVVTEFGPGPEMMAKMGGMSATTSCTGLLKVFDNLSMDNTGKFMIATKEGDAKEWEAGW